MSKPSKTDVWYPFFVGDYRKDTARLSCEQHGAYRQLLDEYWVTGPLPDDDVILAQIVGLELRAWRRQRPYLERFFIIADGVWRQGRVDRELAAAAERKAKAGTKARIAAGVRWGKPDGSVEDATRNAPSMLQAMPEDMHEECPPPSPSSGVVAFPESPERNLPQQRRQASPGQRGSRLKADWTPTSADVAYAMREHEFSQAEINRIAEDYRDYWVAASGQKATKLDWSATWRKWVRTERERRPKTAEPRRVSWV